MKLNKVHQLVMAGLMMLFTTSAFASNCSFSLRSNSSLLTIYGNIAYFPGAPMGLCVGYGPGRVLLIGVPTGPGIPREITDPNGGPSRVIHPQFPSNLPAGGVSIN